MPALATCPTRADLAAFVLGRVPPPGSDEMAQHIEGCPACVAALADLRTPDTLVESLQGTSVSDPPDPRVADLMDRLCRLARAPGDQTAAPPDSWSVPPVPAPVPALAFSADDTSPSGPPSAADEPLDFLAPPQGPDEIGRLGPYRVLKVLGRGGMGVVFLAEDPQLKRAIALKTMRPSVAARPGHRQRFLREAQAAARLESDFIVPIFQVGEDRGVPFLAMPFLKGFSLEDRLKAGGSVPVGEAVRLATQAARGLAAAHAAGLVHRDVKPANLWVEPEGGGRVKVLDFGLAHMGEDQSLTQSGSIMGTPSYMSPEQARGEKVDGRADLFSLGCVLYRMLTGTLPFRGTDAMSTLLALAMHEPPAPHTINPEVPPALSDLVMRLLAKDPAKRPATADDLIRELRKAEGDLARTLVEVVIEPPAGRDFDDPAPATERPKPSRKEPGRGLRIAVAVGLIGVLAAAAGVIIKITRKDGKVEEVELKPGDKFEVVENPGGVPAAATPLALDPGKIPEAERFPWQPKELVAVLGEHRGRHWGTVQQVLWDPQGKFVASVGAGWNGVALWDPQTLRQRAFLPGNPTAAALDREGKSLAVALDDSLGTVRVWDVTGPEPREQTFFKAGEAVAALAFAPDGKTLATGGWSHGAGPFPVRLWDLGGEKPAERAGLKGHTSAVRSLTYWPDGKTLASAGEDKTVRLWDVGAAEPKVKAAIAVEAPVTQLALAPDGKTLAGRVGPKGVLWDVTGPEPKEKGTFGGSGGGVGIAFSPDGKTLVNHDWEGTRLTDLTGPEPRDRAVLRAAEDRDHARVAVAPDGKRLVVAYGRGLLRLWDLSGPEPREVVEPDGHTGALAGAALAPDGKALATFAGSSAWTDPVVRLWDLGGPAPRERARLRHKGRLWHAAFFPDGKALAVAVDDAVVLWDLAGAAPAERAQFKPGDPFVSHISVAADGKTLACCAGNGSVRLWDVSGAQPKERAVLPDCQGVCQFSPDGKTLACYRRVEKGPNLDVLLWDVSGARVTERALIEKTSGSVRGTPPVWSADGSTLAVPAMFRDTFGMLLYDVRGPKPKEVGRLEGCGHTLSFAPDGKTLVYTAWNPNDLPGDQVGELVVWDRAKERPVRRWKLPGVAHPTFTPDGRHLIADNHNGTAYVLRLDGGK